MAHQIVSENFENQKVLLKGKCTIKSFTYVKDSILLMYHTVDI